jgi:N-acetylglutamate synthase-like GNAT family acetyltransferase
MNSVITKASKSDKKSLMRFYKQQSYSASLLGYDNTYMIKYSEEIIGAVIISALEENNPQLFLHALVVKKEFRQKKLGCQLIQHALFQHATQQVICFADESLTHFYQLNNFNQVTEHQLLEPLLRRYLSYRRSLPSMAPRHTVHPEHRRSLPSMAPRHTVHPEHKKTNNTLLVFCREVQYKDLI